MNKTLKSILVITLLTVFAVYSTNAFFSDTESSTNNTLQAGSVDLLVNNTSYYNGEFNEATSWDSGNLDDRLFFNFQDLKPNDYGEDTISITVDDNDAWACMEFELTANDDNTCTEPELLDDPNCEEPGEDLGELGSLVNMIFWVDDGDNVLEQGEQIFLEGTAEEVISSGLIPLADTSGDSLFSSNLNSDGALIGAETYYIGKAWCFGDLTLDPRAVGEYPDGPAGDNNGDNQLGTPEDGGYTCDGSSLNNASQTDILLGDISFRAEQHRNNPDFLCEPLVLIDTVEVPTGSGDGVNSNIILESDTEYLFEASGTYRFANWGEYGIADAEWAYRNDAFTDDPLATHGWTLGENTYSTPTTPPAGGLDILVNNTNIFWGDFSADHTYTYNFTGTGSTVNFSIYDSFYGDNSGTLTVEIYELP